MRRPRGFGPCPIPYAEMRAFEQLAGMRFTPWELEALEAVDAVWLLEHAKRKPTKPEPEAPSDRR